MKLTCSFCLLMKWEKVNINAFKTAQKVFGHKFVFEIFIEPTALSAANQWRLKNKKQTHQFAWGKYIVISSRDQDAIVRNTFTVQCLFG